MPFDGSGNFALLSDFSLDRDLGRPHSLIDADKFDNEMANIRAGLELALLRDGQNEPIGDIPMGGHSFTNMRAAMTGSEPVIASQAVSGAFDWIGVAGGTADAITGALTFNPTLQSGVRIRGIASNTNTDSGNVTFAVNLGSPVAVKRPDGSNLKRGDIAEGRIFELAHNGTEWILTSPLTIDGRGAPMFFLGTATVSGSNISVPLPANFQTLVAGQQFVLSLPQNVGSSPTLSIGGVWVAPVQSHGGANLGTNILRAGYSYILHYNGSVFRVVSPLDATLITSENLADLHDVSAISPSGGDILSFDANTQTWRNESIPGGSISGMLDTNISDVSSNDILYWDGSVWANKTISEILGYTPLDSASYTASDVRTKLLTVDGAGSGVDADLLDGQQGSYYLPASTYTATDILNKIKTVDGAASGLDADTLDGQQGSYYLPAGAYNATDIRSKLLTVDGHGTGIDADLLDGQHGSYYLPASSYSAADVRAKLLTVHGAGSGIDADLLDGQQGSYYADIPARLGYTPLNSASYTASDVRTKLLTVDGAGSGVDADLLDGQQGSYYTDIPARLGYTPYSSAGGTISGAVNITNSLQCDSFRIDQTPTAMLSSGSPADLTHGATAAKFNKYITISANGVTYRVPVTEFALT